MQNPLKGIVVDPVFSDKIFFPESFPDNCVLAFFKGETPFKGVDRIKDEFPCGSGGTMAEGGTVFVCPENPRGIQQKQNDAESPQISISVENTVPK